MKAIRRSDDLGNSTSNHLVKMITGLLVQSSERHRVVLQMVADILTKSAIHISPYEFNELWEGATSQAEAEEEALKLARLLFEKAGHH